MSILQAIHINSPLSEYNENLLNPLSTMDSNLVWSVTSGSATITNSTDEHFQGVKSLKVVNFDGLSVNFNTASNLGCTVEQDGEYIFSYRNMYNTPYGDDPYFGVNIFINGLLVHTLGSIFIENDRPNTWNCFYQNFALNAGDVVSYTFTYSPGGDAGTIWVDGFKFERDNLGFGLPTLYSLPRDYCCGDTNKYTGWAYYVDSLATPTITIGTTYTQITIDGLGATIENYLPKEIRDISSLWSGSKITPISVGDDYDGRFDLTVTAKTGTPTLIELIIDISGGVAGTNKAFTGYIQAGGTIPYSQSIDLDYFSLATFVANGGKLYARTDTGTITIGRRNIKITRKSKAF